MSPELNHEDKKDLVRHFCAYARRLAARKRFVEAKECLHSAKSYAIDNSALLERTRMADEEVQALLSEWLNSLQIETIPLLMVTPLLPEQERSITRIIESLSGLGELERFISDSINFARTIEKSGQYQQMFSVLYNALSLVGEEQGKEMVEEIREADQRRQEQFHQAKGKLNSFWEASSTAPGTTDTLASNGKQLLDDMQRCYLSDVLDDMIICYWNEEERIERADKREEESWQLEVLQRRIQEAKRQSLYQKIEKKIEKWWNSPSLLIDDYEAAVAFSREQTKNYPDEIRLQSLVEEAELRLREAKKDVNGLLTSANQGDFQPLIDAYMVLVDRGYQELPKLITHGESYVLGELEPAEQVVFLVQKYAQDHSDREADQHREQANEVLAADAEKANKEIEDALSLPHLSNKKRLELMLFQKDVIAGESSRQEKAQKLLKKARIAQNAEGYEKAWIYTVEALEEAPKLAAGLHQRQELIPRLRIYWKSLAHSANSSLRKNQFDDAAEDAQRVMEHTLGIKEFEDIFQEAQGIMKTIASHQMQEVGR